MSVTTPEQAILEDLARPLGVWTPVGDPSPGGVQAATLSGGRSDVVDLTTVRFVKQRRSARRRLFFVTFEAVDPRLGPEPRSGGALYPTGADRDGGWRTLGGSSGLGDEPAWSEPRVNLGGGGLSGGGVYAGGMIHGCGREITRVELRFPDGTTLGDDADGGVALFISDDDLGLSAEVVLFDALGSEVGRHAAFPV